MARPLNELLSEELSRLVEPALAAAEDDEQLRQLLLDIGWDIDQIPGFRIAAAREALDELVSSVDALAVLLLQPPATLGELQSALNSGRDAFDRLRSASRLIDTAGSPRPAGFERVGEDLLRYLTLRHAVAEHPALTAVAQLLALVDLPQQPTHPAVEEAATAKVLREPRTFPTFHPRRLASLLSDPLGFLEEFYLPEGRLRDDAAAARLADLLFPRVAALAESFGVESLYGADAAAIHQDATSAVLAGHSIALMARLGADEGAGLVAGAVCSLSPETRGNLGLVVTPFGTLTFRQAAGQWRLDAALGGAIEAFAVGPAGFTLRASPGTASVNARLGARKVATMPREPALLLGSVDGTRLEVGELAATVTAFISNAAQHYEVVLEAARAAIVISAGEGDGFLQQILPKDGLRTDFALGLGWSNSKGIYFRGSAGLEATLPVEQSLLGALSLDSVYLALHADEERGVSGAVAATVTVRLGPVTANVERFGLEAQLAFPPEGGNLGFADLALAFKPPGGAGLRIDADVVTGGGYLFFDPMKQQYAGVLQLEIAGKVALKAVGLLTTKMPDGRPGFSLVVIVTAEGFSPIPLGFGFMLTGVGGLLGVNRKVLVEELRAGIKQGTLDSVLFPSDPVGNAPQLLSTLGAVFPPERDRCFFGPMARITWGTPEILAIDLALVLEVPEPIRLVVLGRLTATLPDKDHPIAHVRMDAIGVVDFNRGELSLDAALYDSRLAEFALTGDMALRASWGAQQTFVLAIGGLHPRFPSPAGSPALERIAISLAGDGNPRMRLDAYLALTSNTVQFGARIDVYAAVLAFELEGFLAFDTLFNLSPFSFVASVGGLLAVRCDGNVVMAMRVEMTLSGPRPWEVRGRARLEFLGLVHEVAFEERIGPAGRPSLLEAVAVLPKLVDAIADVRNWSSELPRDEHPLVTVRATPGEGVRLVHPLATLTVRQQIVPLDRDVTRIGSTRPSDATRFRLEVQGAGGTPAPLPCEPVHDAFAPAQFRDMRDEEKLTSPSFESMPSGLRFGSHKYVVSYQPAYDVNIAYATVTILSDVDLAAAPAPPPAAPPQVVSAAVLARAVPYGASARSPLWRTGRERFRVEPPALERA